MKTAETAIFALRISYDPAKTSAEDIESTLNGILDNAMSTNGILDEIDNPDIGSLRLVATNAALHRYPGEPLAKSEYTASYDVPRPATEGELRELETFAVVDQLAYPQE